MFTTRGRFIKPRSSEHYDTLAGLAFMSGDMKLMEKYEQKCIDKTIKELSTLSHHCHPNAIQRITRAYRETSRSKPRKKRNHGR